MWVQWLVVLVHSAVAVTNPEELVDIRVGTINDRSTFSTGNVFPAISRPWGFNHWSIQTTDPNDGSWFFANNDRKFYGIRCTHQPSPWIGDYGQFALMPAMGTWDSEFAGGYAPESSEFHPYYFNTTVLGYGTSLGSPTIEFTPTDHAGLFRIRYPPVSPPSNNDGDQTRRIALVMWNRGDTVTTVGNNAIHGFSSQNSGGVPGNFKFYFYITFSSPFFSFDSDVSAWYVSFDAADSKTQEIIVSVGTSFISVDQAKSSLNEITTSFDGMVAEAKGVWHDLLSRVDIVDAGPYPDPAFHYATFYSNMYRSMLFPRKAWEVDAGGNVVHYSPYSDGGNVFPGPLSTDSGFWDAYRTVYPQLSLFFQDRLTEVLNGWLNAYKEGGWLPKWASPGYRAGMTGTMGDLSLADAIVKEIPGIDYNLAYQAIRKDAFEAPTRMSNGAVGRFCLTAYMQYGYIPIDTTMSTGSPADQTVSRTQNYALADFAIAQAATKLNQSADAATLLTRSKYYRNLWDPSTKLFRPKWSNGSFVGNFDQWAWGGEYTEAGPWQYRFYAPHDVDGVINLYGSKDNLCSTLDKFMAMKPVYHFGGYRQQIHEMLEMAIQGTLGGTPAGFFGQYEMDNQPVHHVLYMYIAAGCPAHAQYWIRQTCSRLYSPTFFSGDEDNGEMSSWYLLSSLGLYALVPGTPDYLIGSPMFRSVSIKLPNSKTLNILASNNAPENYYVQSVSWNKTPLTSLSIPYSTLMQGGDLEFVMSPQDPTIKQHATS